MYHLSLATFKAFSMALDFRSLIMMYLGVDLWGLFFTALSLLLQYIYIFLPNGGKKKSSTFMFKMIFQPHSLYPFLLGSNDMNVETFFIRSLEVPGGSEVKASACNVRDPGSIPESGRYPGEGNGNPLQYFCLGKPMDRTARWATVHGVAKECHTT